MLRVKRTTTKRSTRQTRSRSSKIRSLQDALASAELRLEERGTFVAGMSHELREPINGVLGMARLLRDTPLDDEQAGYVDAVIESAESLVTLVNDILDLSKIDTGRIELNPVEFSLPAFFQRLAESFTRRATAKGIRFVLELATDLPDVARGDPGRLRQITTNIVANAIKFTSCGHVSLTVSAFEGTDNARVGIVIRTVDTGIGIPADRQAELFSPYTQANAETGRLYGGSGLGLVIAQRLASVMDGSLELESSSDAGTVFVARVMLERSGELRPRSERAVIAGARLLIADSQRRTARVMGEMARLWSMDVRITATAAETLTVLQESADRGAAFDFAVIDRNLEDQRGDKIGPLVRAAPALAGLKLVLMAAGGVRGDAAAVQRLGFDGYLQKPVAGSTLLNVLQQLQGAKAAGQLLTMHSLNEGRGRPLRLLIADDNPVNCRLAGIMLERAGHTVATVPNGAAAVAAVQAESFDAVLMDIQMPVMGGLEATRQIRALTNHDRADVPIIAITANAMRGDDDDCYAAGMSGYVTKPIDSALLLQTLDRLTAAAERG